MWKSGDFLQGHKSLENWLTDSIVIQSEIEKFGHVKCHSDWNLSTVIEDHVYIFS